MELKNAKKIEFVQTCTNLYVICTYLYMICTLLYVIYTNITPTGCSSAHFLRFFSENNFVKFCLFANPGKKNFIIFVC